MENTIFERIKQLHSEGKNDKEIAISLNLSKSTIQRYRKVLKLKPVEPKPRILSEEIKKIISQKRKEWLRNNPDKHPWRNKDKFQSKPCKKVEEYLKSNNIFFVSEYNPDIPDRFFSIDIALPDKMIAIEINGNQHYSKEGTLKPYYQERHDLLESHGWRVFEIHYSHCFHLEKWDNFLNTLVNTAKLIEFDYGKYLSPRKKSYKKKDIMKLKLEDNYQYIKETELINVQFCICGEPITKGAKTCVPCNRLKRRKVKERPTKEELLSLVGQIPMVKIGKMYGVSDNCIRKWLKA